MNVIFHEDNKKYISKCINCDETINFKINDLTFDQFKYKCIKETNYSFLNCYRCYSKIKDQNNNFICEVCQHVFCNNTLFFSN